MRRNLKITKIIICFLVIFSIVITETVPFTLDVDASGKQSSKSTVSKPIVKNSSSKRYAKWDCIWLGSYPQIEIVDKKVDGFVEGTDYIVDGDTFKLLENAFYELKRTGFA